MRVMGIQAIYPKPNLSRPNKGHTKYPYLLRGLDIVRPNQVWATDITYIRLIGGWLYLVVVMDWYSRYIVSWQLSENLGTGFCIEAMEEALHRGRPDIQNMDQGSQFTSNGYQKILLENGIQISMDGRGRAFDNIFTERFWRTVKYEEVYIKDYQTLREARESLTKYIQFYNEKRLHQSLNYQTPAEVHYG